METLTQKYKDKLKKCETLYRKKRKKLTPTERKQLLEELETLKKEIDNSSKKFYEEIYEIRVKIGELFNKLILL